MKRFRRINALLMLLLSVPAWASNLPTPASAELCGRHSPVGTAIGDMSLEKKVSWEGITCDYCHSLRSVSMAEANPKAAVDFTLVKTGPLKNASSIAHGTKFSEVHTSALACAPCHEYQNALGFPVLTTFSE
jgi:hypothetical protein